MSWSPELRCGDLPRMLLHHVLSNGCRVHGDEIAVDVFVLHRLRVGAVRALVPAVQRRQPAIVGVRHGRGAERSIAKLQLTQIVCADADAEQSLEQFAVGEQTENVAVVGLSADDCRDLTLPLLPRLIHKPNNIIRYTQLQLNLVTSPLVKPPNSPLATRGCGTDFLQCI